MLVFPCCFRERFGILTMFALLVGILSSHTAVASDSITLPPMFDRDDLLQAAHVKPSYNDVQLQLGGIMARSNNIGSLWEMSEDGQPPRTFEGGSAYALLQNTEWMRISNGDWCIGYGRGSRDSYNGNADAAQLWIDLHADGATKQAYAPTVSSESISASWYGVGRTVAFRADNMSGTMDIWLRQIVADDYLGRSIAGRAVTSPSESFSGMLRIVSAVTSASRVEGRGWSLDAQTVLHFGENWECGLIAEGLLGKMRWNGLGVRDGYFNSPGVFTDRDGFLRDYGGITGSAWREDMTLSLNPRYRIEVIRLGNPSITLAYDYQAGARPVPSLGITSSQSEKWSPYVRYYPTQSRVELGAVAANWRFRISSDDWPTDSPKNVEVAFAASVVRF